MIPTLPADLTAAGLHYVTDVSDDWSRVSMQVQRSLVHPTTAHDFLSLKLTNCPQAPDSSGRMHTFV
jgi:hypothetical protein